MARVKIGFVAAGGAARGLAHLGVLKACEELGIVPEIYVGTSTGAIVGAAYGQDVPLDVLLDGYRLPWRRRHRGLRLYASGFLGPPRLRDLAHPGYLLSGVFSIDKLERHLRGALPINDFRQLPNQVFIPAVDIASGQRVVFGPGYEESTRVSEAVAASCCVPGLFRPYRVGERWLVDGEIARTLSADIAIAAGADVVIISNVYRPEQPDARRRPLAHRGVLAVARQSLNILLSEKERRGVELLSHLHPRVTLLDIAPDIGGFGYFNRFSVRSLVLRGYKTALCELAAAKERGVFDSQAPDLRIN